MIPTLLWRCPLCKTHDALTHQPRRFRHDLVSCQACGTQWELIRVVGGNDYRLRVVAGERAGFEQPLSAWYDMVKADVRLEPMTDASLLLEPGEALYLKSKAVELSIQAANPFFSTTGEGEPQPFQPGEIHFGTHFAMPVGLGRLFLTSERLICLSPGKVYPHLAADEKSAYVPTSPTDGTMYTYSFWLKSVPSAYLFMDVHFTIFYEGALYMFRFTEESLLKWFTYFAEVCKGIEARYGNPIELTW